MLVKSCLTQRNLSSSIPLPLLNLLERLHRSVQRVLVISSELGVGALERGVAEGLWLFDTVILYVSIPVGFVWFLFLDSVAVGSTGEIIGRWERSWIRSYPLRCAFFDWLCWDEFLDSVRVRGQHLFFSPWHEILRLLRCWYDACAEPVVRPDRLSLHRHSKINPSSRAPCQPFRPHQDLFGAGVYILAIATVFLGFTGSRKVVECVGVLLTHECGQSMKSSEIGCEGLWAAKFGRFAGSMKSWQRGCYITRRGCYIQP